MKTIIPCLTAILATAIITPAQSEERDSSMPNQDAMVKQLEPLKDKAFDAAFLKMMIAHHNTGIQMAELAQDRASNEQLKEFARQMVQSHKEQREKMNEWLKSWELSEQGPKMEAGQEKDQQHMKHLQELKGQEFDKAFISIMIPHHKTGIAMLELVSERSDREALESFAKKGIKEQRDEIEKLQKFQSSGTAE